MTPDELRAVLRDVDTAAEQRIVRLKWFLFFLPFIWALIGGVLYALVVQTSRT